MLLLALRPGALAELEVDGVLAVIELPMLEVKPELTLPESLFDSEFIREGALALLPGLEIDGVPEPMELPIRDVTAESIRLLELRTLELGAAGRPTFKEPEDGADTEGAAGEKRLEILGATLLGAFDTLEREGEDTDGLGATVTLGLRLGVEMTGGRAERTLKSLLGPRLLEIEGLGPRLILGGELIRGAGAGLGAERTEEERFPPESFLSSFAVKMGA